MAETRSRSSARSHKGSPERILRIVSEVGRYGLLSSEQIARIDGGSRQVCMRVLQYCVEKKLLRRLDQAPEAFLGSFFDARPRVYAVTKTGLSALTDAGVPLNVAPKRNAVLLAHEIETANFCFDLRAAIAAEGSLALLDEPELKSMMPVVTQQMDKPLRLRAIAHPHNFPHLGDLLAEPVELATEPDRLVAIMRRDGKGWARAVEIDRGHEDVSAKVLKGRATWARKAIGYHAAWLHGTHLKQWGEFCRSFRVAMVTTSEARVRNMIDIQMDITRGVAGLFIYSTPERLKQHGVLGPAWLNGKSDGFSLIGE